MLELTEDRWANGDIRLNIVGDTQQEVRRKAEEYKETFKRYRAVITLDATPRGKRWFASVSRSGNRG